MTHNFLSFHRLCLLLVSFLSFTICGCHKTNQSHISQVTGSFVGTLHQWGSVTNPPDTFDTLISSDTFSITKTANDSITCTLNYSRAIGSYVLNGTTYHRDISFLYSNTNSFVVDHAALNYNDYTEALTIQVSQSNDSLSYTYHYSYTPPGSFDWVITDETFTGKKIN